MTKQNVSLGFRLNKTDETRNYLLEEIKCNEFMSEKHPKICRALNNFEHFLVFVSPVNGCVSISTFSSLVIVSIDIASSAVGLRIFCYICRN